MNASGGGGAQSAKRARKLREQLHLHNYRYYSLDDPSCTDEEYDRLFAELKDLEDEHPELIAPDSPTRRVGAPLTGGFERVPHLLPMLSLDNATEFAEVEAFEERVRRRLSLPDGALDYSVEPKLDGLAVSLIYRHGQLHLGLTRGDGESGEDVTANLRAMAAIPLVLRADGTEAPPPLLEARLEVYMPRSGFEALNERMRREDKKLFVNPRNAAASSVRQLDPAITRERPLSYFCHSLGACEGWDNPPDSHGQVLQQLASWGLRINPRNSQCASVDEVRERYRQLQDERDTLDYDMDGMVCKLDSLQLRERMGQRGREPRWALAWKFAPQERTTVVREIELQVGRTGAVTPVGKLEPVHVGGVTVSNVSLHNFDEVARLDVRVGDEVTVRRAGDVIPKVVAVNSSKRADPPSPPILPPTHCPCPLQLPVARAEGEVVLRCTGGHDCPERRQQALVHFVSRGCVDIRGLSGKLLAQLLAEHLIQDAADLYLLADKRPQLLELQRQAETSVDKLLKSIEVSRQVRLDKLIFALGIEHIGEVAARTLAQKFRDLASLAAADEEALQDVSGIGAEMAGALIAWFGDSINADLVHRLSAALRVEAPVDSGPLAGLAFLFTGTLSEYSRNEAKDRLQRFGAEIRSAMSASVDYVVAGEKAGSKLTKAQEMGIGVLTGEDFERLLQDPEGFARQAQR